MTKNTEEDSSKQSILLTILFTIFSCLIWSFIIIFIFKIPVLSWSRQTIQPLINWLNQAPVSDDGTGNLNRQATSDSNSGAETLIADQQTVLQKIGQNTVTQYKYPLFFYPVSQNTRLPMDFPNNESQLPLVKVGEVSVAEIIYGPIVDLMDAAKGAGFSPYLRSGFRSIDDQYTAYSNYVTEATAAGKDITEARIYASRFSAQPGYSEHHLGLAVDLLDYFYPDWIVARNNYDKGLYLWLRLNAHKYGFVISYPTGAEKLLAKPDSGYELSEPWHLRFVGKDLALWLYNNAYLDQDNGITVDSILREIYLMIDGH